MSDPLPPVVKATGWRLWSEETLIDMGLGTPEMIARDKARTAALEARRRADPWRYKWRPLIWRAVAALAGAIARWAERWHDRLHPTTDFGCSFCIEQDRRRDP